MFVCMFIINSGMTDANSIKGGKHITYNSQKITVGVIYPYSAKDGEGMTYKNNQITLISVHSVVNRLAGMNLDTADII